MKNVGAAADKPTDAIDQEIAVLSMQSLALLKRRKGNQAAGREGQGGRKRR